MNNGFKKFADRVERAVKNDDFSKKLTLDTVLNDLTGFIDFLVYESSHDYLEYLKTHLFENCVNTGETYHLIKSDGWIEYEKSDYLTLPEDKDEKEVFIDVINLLIKHINKQCIAYKPPKRATPEQYEEWVSEQEFCNND
ncbi:TPA: hypothetical protein RFV54_003717 [Klebsiella aerogenes]|nr:hypothetical protein [Klebsiella aerogenes]